MAPDEGVVYQCYICCECEEWKLDTLSDLYEFEIMTITQAVIWIHVNSNIKARWVGEQMAGNGLTTSVKTVDMDRTQQEHIDR